jgi:hypothetical protein
MRALRLTLRDLWEALPPGDSHEEVGATWEGLTLGLGVEQARDLELRLRQSSVDHAARGEPADAHVAQVYAKAATVLRESFDFADLPDRPTGAPRPPRSLDWDGWLCESGFMIWDTRVTPTRADFIQHIQRGSLER